MARILKLLVACSVLIISLAPIKIQENAKKYASINLIAPAFVQDALAGNSEIGQYLDDEAGISAYFHSDQPINLNLVRDSFTIIETETPEYIIGTVNTPPYDTLFTPHVYVHESGWILSYYLNTDPASKMIDGAAHSLNSTILKSSVIIIANAALVPFTDVTYYDFRYPNANKILMVAKDENLGNTYTIEVPSSFIYSQYSWAYFGWGSGNTIYTLDGVNLLNSSLGCGSPAECYGVLTSSQMLPDVTHTIVAYSYWYASYAVLVITYSEP
jgi:hypothetical protein